MEPEAPEVSRVRALGARTETRDGGQGRLRHTQSALEGRGGWPGSRVGGGFEAGSQVGGGFEAGHRYLGGGTRADSLRLSPTGHSALCLSLIQGSGALRWPSPFPCKRGPRLGRRRGRTCPAGHVTPSHSRCTNQAARERRPASHSACSNKTRALGRPLRRKQ